MTKKTNTNDYSSFLDRAKALIPEELSVTQRLEIPKVTGHVQGNKTILSNFFQICKILDREPEVVLKFILKELASKGDIKNNFILFNNRIPSAKINEKIEKYAKLFVICKECSKPETKLTKENNINIVTCQACGARYTVAYRI